MALDVPLLIEKPMKLELSATLATYSYGDEMKDVR